MINLTPHTITIRHKSGADVSFPPSGTLARVGSFDKDFGGLPVSSIVPSDGTNFGGGEAWVCPVVKRVYGAVTGLPEPGTPCLVSVVVLAAVPGRDGVFAPDTGPTAIRDDNGLIIAVTQLVAA